MALKRLLCLASVPLCVGCSPGIGTAPPARPPPPMQPDPVTRPGATRAYPIRTCGARQSYRLVASIQCRDGSAPLAGDWRQASRARSGSVGPGPDGHIQDLYRVPCPEGPLPVYVDMYHCPGGGSPLGR